MLRTYLYWLFEAKKRFFELADCLGRSRDPEEQKRLKEDLARMTYGE